MEDHTIMLRWPVKRTHRYFLKSYGRMETGDNVLSDRIRQMALHLPRSGNRSSRELAARWLRTGADAAAVIDQALQYFRERGFVYTLNPPLMQENRIDTFLFDVKAGYCEHYASAFAFLMRAAGIPARVVVGYMGGDLNPYGGYFVVKQYHAHAWAEVFVPGRGWLRIDPTTAVVPQRVSAGLAGALRPEELPSFLRRSGYPGIRAYWDKAGLMWDNLNLRWNAWFMGFSLMQQRGLWVSILTWLQVFKYHCLVAILITAVSGVALFIYRRRPERVALRPVEKAYGQFCNKLARVGVSREPSQGPADFRQMAVCLRGDLKEDVNAIIDDYIRLRYGRTKGQTEEKTFIGMVKRFDPDRRVEERSAPSV